jgi:hypothetical protein
MRPDPAHSLVVARSRRFVAFAESKRVILTGAEVLLVTNVTLVAGVSSNFAAANRAMAVDCVTRFHGVACSEKLITPRVNVTRRRRRYARAPKFRPEISHSKPPGADQTLGFWKRPPSTGPNWSKCPSDLWGHNVPYDPKETSKGCVRPANPVLDV